MTAVLTPQPGTRPPPATVVDQLLRMRGELSGAERAQFLRWATEVPAEGEGTHEGHRGQTDQGRAGDLSIVEALGDEPAAPH